MLLERFEKGFPMRSYDFCLTREYDACGEVCGGGFHYCPKCNICLCFLCGIILINAGYGFPITCPMCGEKFKSASG
jgi:hypothetical protein